MLTNPREFWHEYMGKRLTNPSLALGESHKAILPHRTLSKDSYPMRIGALDLFYIVTPEKAVAIGRVALPDNDHVKFVGTEKVSARKYVAEWLLHEATGPYMVGVFGKADAEASFRISHHPSVSYFCEKGAGFGFDLELVRAAHKKIEHLSWQKVVSRAIHQYARFKQAEGEEQNLERFKLQKMLISEPTLREILPTLGILPNSGEYTILSWLNILKAI